MSETESARIARVNRVAARAGYLIKHESASNVTAAVFRNLGGDPESWDDAAIKATLQAMADGAGRDHFERLTSNLSPMQKIEAGNERQSRKDKSAAPATKQDFADEKERARIMALPVHLRTAWADEQIQRKRTEGNI